MGPVILLGVVTLLLGGFAKVAHHVASEEGQALHRRRQALLQGLAQNKGVLLLLHTPRRTIQGRVVSTDGEMSVVLDVRKPEAILDEPPKPGEIEIVNLEDEDDVYITMLE